MALSKIIPALIGGAVGKAGAGKGLLGAGIGLVAARIARRSVPGALLVGGAMAAKWLYDKKQEEKANAAAPPPPPVTPPPANP
jgi:hypothetical protein